MRNSSNLKFRWQADVQMNKRTTSIPSVRSACPLSSEGELKFFGTDARPAVWIYSEQPLKHLLVGVGDDVSREESTYLLVYELPERTTRCGHLLATSVTTTSRKIHLIHLLMHEG